jgi:hypothetical protein
MRIKLLGPWTTTNGQPERYYMLLEYYSCRGWFIRETGWEGLHTPPQVTKYYYNPYEKGDFIQYTPKGMEFTFKDADEYLLYCKMEETTEDGWPNPSWAIACELIPGWLD